ncbi:coiled-coil domain-containing protein [Paenibacillus puerhi]|uniref:hypothetical protein n=1 Tax=Paenibacillus puerhi TaxID=2692622 RepID=UPI00135B3542|nr:hypothetical protein [Paenibacillus puerhi]
MKIKKVAVGNSEEAFIENKFSEGLNIISSDDNNKGKTIVIQSMMYALGNEPIFPSSFNFKEYYYIIEFELDNIPVTISRKLNSFVVLYKSNLSTFDNQTEFKHYINNNLFKLPMILKDGFKKIVDPVLFYQIFFVGQDSKNTSNIFQAGYYNKTDFFNMIYSYAGIETHFYSDLDENQIKERIQKLKAEKKELQKQNKILKSTLSVIGLASKSNDRMKFEEKLSSTEKIKTNIIGLNSQRNNALSRKIKNEITLKELRSLNQSLSAGILHCLDCGSKNIGYSTSDKSYTFDISSNEIRSQILISIEEKINIYSEEIERLTFDINKYQDELQSLLSIDEVSLQSLLLYKSELISAGEADSRILSISKELKELERSLTSSMNKEKENQIERKELRDQIFEKMNEFYKTIEPNGNLFFDDLFSRRQSVYSGVEETEFYLSKLYALLSVLKHRFPIIIDYFRDGELSTVKEKKVLDLFKEFDNQVIFTATLKDEEIGKYNNVQMINHINYMDHIPFKLLSRKYVQDFLLLSDKLSISIKSNLN